MIITADKRTINEMEYALLIRGMKGWPEGDEFTSGSAIISGKSEEKITNSLRA